MAQNVECVPFLKRCLKMCLKTLVTFDFLQSSKLTGLVSIIISELFHLVRQSGLKGFQITLKMYVCPYFKDFTHEFIFNIR